MPIYTPEYLLTMNSTPSIKTEVFVELEAVEKAVRQVIGTFALPKLSQAYRWLERTDLLQKRSEALRKEAMENLREGKNLLSGDSVEQPQAEPAPQHKEMPSSFPPARGGKARGRECRAAFLKREAELERPLTRIRGQLHKNAGGSVVGIAYNQGNERKNEWILGLPAGEFKEAVLLCEMNDFKVQPIHLPESFIAEHGQHLYVSRQYNQAKFKIRREANRYFLVTKNSRDVDVTDYAATEQIFCPPTEHV